MTPLALLVAILSGGIGSMTLVASAIDSYHKASDVPVVQPEALPVVVYVPTVPLWVPFAIGALVLAVVCLSIYVYRSLHAVKKEVSEFKNKVSKDIKDVKGDLDNDVGNLIKCINELQAQILGVSELVKTKISTVEAKVSKVKNSLKKHMKARAIVFKWVQHLKQNQDTMFCNIQDLGVQAEEGIKKEISEQFEVVRQSFKYMLLEVHDMMLSVSKDIASEFCIENPRTSSSTREEMPETEPVG